MSGECVNERCRSKVYRFYILTEWGAILFFGPSWERSFTRHQGWGINSCAGRGRGELAGRSPRRKPNEGPAPRPREKSPRTAPPAAPADVIVRPKLGDDPAGASEQDRLAAFLGELTKFHPELPRVTSSRCPNDSSASRTARSFCRPTSRADTSSRIRRAQHARANAAGSGSCRTRAFR